MVRQVIVQRKTLDWAGDGYSNAMAARTFVGIKHPDEKIERTHTYQQVLRHLEFWDATFAVPFAECRKQLKSIAHSSWAKVNNCSRIYFDHKHESLEEELIGKPVIILFTDDDDWFAPHIFERLAYNYDHERQGWLWNRSKFDGNLITSPIGDPIYAFTNNYALNGKFLEAGRVVSDIMEHGFANRGFTRGNLDLYILEGECLSVTNKAPCSRNMLLRAMESECPKAALVANVARYVDEIPELKTELSWAEPLMQKSREFFQDVLVSLRG